MEYYLDLGRPGAFPSPEQQQHQLFAQVDFKVGDIDVDFGVGYGLEGVGLGPVRGKDHPVLRVPGRRHAGQRQVADEDTDDPEGAGGAADLRPHRSRAIRSSGCGDSTPDPRQKHLLHPYRPRGETLLVHVAAHRGEGGAVRLNAVGPEVRAEYAPRLLDVVEQERQREMQRVAVVEAGDRDIARRVQNAW